MISRACNDCGTIHVASDVKAMGRFSVGAYGYSTADGVLHTTREQAQEHLCQKRQRERPSTPANSDSHEWLGTDR